MEDFSRNFRLRGNKLVLLLLNDCEDEHGYFVDLQCESLIWNAQVIMVASFSEAAIFLRTLNAYQGRTVTAIQGQSKAITF